MTSTAIVGEYDNAVVHYELHRLRDAFNGKTNASLVKGGVPVDWDIFAMRAATFEFETFSRDQVDPIILLGRTFKGKWQDIVPASHKEYEVLARKPCTHGLDTYSYRIYPIPRVAFAAIKDESMGILNVKKKLHALQYYVVPDWNLWDFWNEPSYALQRKITDSDIERDECKILMMQRSRLTRLKAFDPRAEVILETLFSHCTAPAHAKYTFVGYELLDSHEDYNEWLENVRKQKPHFIKQLTANDVREGILESVCKTLPADCVLGIRSTMQIGSDTYHLPLLDLIGIFLPNQVLGKPYTQRISAKEGMLVKSSVQGKHFYGFEPLKPDEWFGFLQETARTNGCITPSFIDFSVERGFSTLRLTPALNKLAQPAFESLHLLKKWNFGVIIDEKRRLIASSSDIEIEQNK